MRSNSRSWSGWMRPRRWAVHGRARLVEAPRTFSKGDSKLLEKARFRRRKRGFHLNGEASQIRRKSLSANARFYVRL